MRGINQLLIMGAAVILCLAAGDASAQTNQNGGRQRQGGGRQGNYDPAQFQQRTVDRYRDRLEITDDSEWKAIQPLIQKVVEARTTGGRGSTALGRGRRGRTGNSSDTGQRRNTALENTPAEDLQKAVDTKAPTSEMKGALAKYAEYRKSKRAELEKAQENLRSVLTSRQEAIAVLSGLL
ncbi:MAG TPA: hypothetical protein VN794_06025 [Methylomirabilota bacterium]|nr:hypothetical protein [Methylomirabilota bacterium]